MRTISKQCSKVRDDVIYQEVVRLDKNDLVTKPRVKVSIKSNSYSFQSHARISRWDGSEWQLVHNLLPNEMKTPHGLDTMSLRLEQKAMEAKFTADRNELLRVAKEILDA